MWALSCARFGPRTRDEAKKTGDVFDMMRSVGVRVSGKVGHRHELKA